MRTAFLRPLTQICPIFDGSGSNASFTRNAIIDHKAKNVGNESKNGSIHIFPDMAVNLNGIRFDIDASI